MILHRTDGSFSSCSIVPGLNGTGFLEVDSMWRQRSSSFLLESAEEELLLALLGTMIWHKFSDERLGMALAMHASGFNVEQRPSTSDLCATYAFGIT